MKVLPKGHRSCFDQAFKYTPAARTDIARTFARLKREQRQAEADAKAIAEERARVVKPLIKARV